MANLCQRYGNLAAGISSVFQVARSPSIPGVQTRFGSQLAQSLGGDRQSTVNII
ncbi:MAG: hypothetical protein WBA10_11825 [Elainellaceae cyanobacterium]